MVMIINEFSLDGIKITIIEKSEHEMIGYKKPANLGDGSIGSFLNQLIEKGKISKLAGTLQTPQQIWVCLSDCLSCDVKCSGFQVCCIICVEKTVKHDFSSFTDNELFTFRLPASKWVRYETQDYKSLENLHRHGIYELVKKFGYQWNESIRLHFDNEHECHNNEQFYDGKTAYFVLPVVDSVRKGEVLYA